MHFSLIFVCVWRWRARRRLSQIDLFAFLIFFFLFEFDLCCLSHSPVNWIHTHRCMLQRRQLNWIGCGVASVDGLDVPLALSTSPSPFTCARDLSIWHIFEMEMLVIVLNFCLLDFQDHFTQLCGVAVIVAIRLVVIIINPIYAYMVLCSALFIFNTTRLINENVSTRQKKKERKKKRKKNNNNKSIKFLLGFSFISDAELLPLLYSRSYAHWYMRFNHSIGLTRSLQSWCFSQGFSVHRFIIMSLIKRSNVWNINSFTRSPNLCDEEICCLLSVSNHF